MNLTDNIADHEADAGFLASCTKGESAPLVEALEKVRDCYFTTTRHRLIWETLKRIDVDEADELTVLLTMPAADLEDCGGREAVMEVLNSTETSIQWKRYLASLEKHAKLRQLRRAGMETLEAIADDPEPDELVEKLDATLLELRHEDAETFLPASQVLSAGLAEIEARAAGQSPGIQCGIPAFDAMREGTEARTVLLPHG